MTEIKNNFSTSELKYYNPSNKLKIITSTALFDGHDASINIIRRLLQARGVEIVHLGHNRSAYEIAKAAIEEDVQAIALSSYQGGHLEFFSYLRKLLNDSGGYDIKIFGGGGGVITPKEVKELEKNGVEKIYTPEDGQFMGLQGMIDDLVKRSDFSFADVKEKNSSYTYKLARKLSLLENNIVEFDHNDKTKKNKKPLIIGITGTGGAGKSSLLDEIILRFKQDYTQIKIAVICVDPSKKTTGGALLGDRIRMNTSSDENIFVRSFATREQKGELAKTCNDAIALIANENKFDLIFLETSGIGQSDSAVVSISDISIYVMTSEYGAPSQLEKIEMLDLADLIIINKFEKNRGPDALRDVENTIRRNRFKGIPIASDNNPVFGTIASKFNDDGVNGAYKFLLKKLSWENNSKIKRVYSRHSKKRYSLIKASRQHYLSDIANTIRKIS